MDDCAFRAAVNVEMTFNGGDRKTNRKSLSFDIVTWWHCGYLDGPDMVYRIGWELDPGEVYLHML